LKGNLKSFSGKGVLLSVAISLLSIRISNEEKEETAQGWVTYRIKMYKPF